MQKVQKLYVYVCVNFCILYYNIPFLFRIEEVWKKVELLQTFATFAPFAF